MNSLPDEPLVSFLLTANPDLNGRVKDAMVSKMPEVARQIQCSPALEIEGKIPEVPLEDYDKAIFVSSSAVDYALKHSQSIAPLLPERLFAIGPKTAERLKAEGYQEVEISEGFTSEDLLKHSDLQSLSGEHILLVKGEGGRELLATELKERGANIYPVEVYRRRGLFLQLDIERLKQTRSLVIMVSSVSAAANVLDSLNHQGVSDMPRCWVTVSRRIADALEEQEEPVLNCDSIDAQDIASAMLSITDTLMPDSDRNRRS